MKFNQIDDKKEDVEVGAVKCRDLIKSWTDITEGEKYEMLEEMYDDQWYCPNVTSFKIQGDELTGASSFQMELTPDESLSPAIVKNSLLITTTLSRYFDVKDYSKKDYQKVIPFRTETIRLNPNVTQNSVSQV